LAQLRARRLAASARTAQPLPASPAATTRTRRDIRLAPIPRIAITREEAAAALGMRSVDSFERHVQPEIRLIRRGRFVLVPVAELERFAHEAAENTLP
jgi:hypothetical protein